MLLVEVEDRRAVTLEPIIQQYVLPRSHVISDGWATYANIDPIRNGIYMCSITANILSIPTIQIYTLLMWIICGCGQKEN